jgi:hypothetical protein
MRNAARLGAGLAALMACTAAVTSASVPHTYKVAPGTADSAAITPCAPDPAGPSTFSCANLRSAVAAAQGDTGSTVQLAAGEYVLTAGQLTSSTDKTFAIAGTGSGQTTITQATAGQRVIKLPLPLSDVTIRGLTVTGGDQTTIDGSCTTNSGEVDGGGIFNAGTLTLSDVTVSGNQATGTDGANANSGSAGTGAAANGGGICSSGPLTVIDSTISGNRATGGAGGKGTGSASGGWGGSASGGGIETTGNITLSGTAVGSNQAIGGAAGKVTGSGDGGNGGGAFGGAISVDQGPGPTNPTASITDGRIEGNAEVGGAGAQVFAASALSTAGGSAFGAISDGSFGAITITRSMISSNSASGGVAGTRGNGASGGTGGNVGGAGISTDVAPLTLTASTVSGNSAFGGPPAVAAAGGSGGSGFGGGLNVGNQTAIVNSTISGNRLSVGTGASADGGGLYVEQIGGSVTTLASVTLAANGVTAVTPAMAAGGTLDHNVASPITASDTIVAGGSTNGTGANCGHKIATDAGHNLESTTPSQCGLGSAIGDLIGADPLLGALASNGGATQTIALGAGSPAIGAGGQCTDPASGGQPLRTDQRADARANPCDIGAFEGQPPTVTTAPAISGKAAVGKTVRCSPGSYGGDNPLTSAFQWQRNGAAIAGATGQTHRVVLADAAHKLTCQVTESNPYGRVGGTSAAVRVALPAPTLGALHQSHKRWREGSRLARLSSATIPVGTTFRVKLNLVAHLTLAFSRSAPGAKHKKAAGTLTLTSAHAGLNKVRFAGRLSKHRRLPTGRYRLSVIAKNSGGRSKPRSASFTIVRPP